MDPLVGKLFKDSKESNPVEVAEHAVSAKLVSEPAFAWWVPFALKRRDRIISKIDARFAKKSHKFGIAVPATVKEALQMDKDNGNAAWWDSIQKEMKNVRVAFNVLDDDANLPPGHTFVKCHVIFDVKMDLTRKSRYVAGLSFLPASKRNTMLPWFLILHIRSLKGVPFGQVTGWIFMAMFKKLFPQMHRTLLVRRSRCVVLLMRITPGTSCLDDLAQVSLFL
jgi:hypothetical protein